MAIEQKLKLSMEAGELTDYSEYLAHVSDDESDTQKTTLWHRMLKHLAKNSANDEADSHTTENTATHCVESQSGS